MKEVLIDCAKIERLAADIYQQLATQSSFSDKVRTTFAHLAEDEREHAAQFDSLLQLPLESLGIVKRLGGQKIVEALRSITHISEDLDQYTRSEEAALSLAVKLEENFMRIHLNNALHFTEQKVADVFEHLGRGDAAHLATLNECLSWWKSKHGRETI